MIKFENDSIDMEGDGIDLMAEATEIMVSVIEALVENNTLEAKDIPNVIDIVANELYKQTRPLIRAHNRKYN